MINPSHPSAFTLASPLVLSPAGLITRPIHNPLSPKLLPQANARAGGPEPAKRVPRIGASVLSDINRRIIIQEAS